MCGGIGLLYEVSIIIVRKSEKVVHGDFTVDDTFMFSVHHSVCGDKCDYQCLSGLCRHTEQSHPFAEFHLVIISDGITVSAELHFAQMDDTVCSLDNHINLEARHVFVRICLASP